MGTSPEGSFEFEMQRFMQASYTSPQLSLCLQAFCTAQHLHTYLMPLTPASHSPAQHYKRK